MANAIAETVAEQAPLVDAAAGATPNAALAHRSPADVRMYYRAYRMLEKFQSLAETAFTAIWLGALTDRRRHAIDRVYFDRERVYHTSSYNEQGLWGWEQQVVNKYFSGCERVLVACAGGGREVIALRRMGIDATGFECHPDLCAFANILLERLGFVADVRSAARDECPSFAIPFTGTVVGWSGYMLIRGSNRRVSFLRGLRSQMTAGAPALISFVTRRRGARKYIATAAVANALRGLLGGERAEVGDYLLPNYVHFFTRDEIERELNAAGFELAFFSPTPYGHAVGSAH